MILLTLLAVGLLTLSSVSLRAGGQGAAKAEAMANARLALMIALGELQTSMGPDQRISANASSVAGENTTDPNLLGAWESWRWQPGSSGPSYSEKAARFRRWLVSTKDYETARTAVPKLSDTIWLVKPPETTATASSSATKPFLRAERVPVSTTTNRGGFAWGVMDESMKAPINLPESKPTQTGDRLARRTAPGRARPEAILPVLAPDKLGDPNKILSLDTAVVAVGKDQGKTIPDHQAYITPYSVGLLTNVAEGGIRTDLTTLFESASASPNVNGQQTLYYAANDGAPRWDFLRSHYQLYRRVTAAASGKPQLTLSSTDLRPTASGVIPTTSTERLLPVVAKLQIMFSAVTHYNHIGDRVNFFNTKGNPAGNQNYGCPHLVYDPVITLYNPYDIALDLTKMRIRIWDPPVRFGFKKNEVWLRDEFATGDFHPMGRFMIANERNQDAHRYFTMLLTQLTGSRPGARIRLEPGEVKVFSPWLETNWTWGLETSGGYSVRCFFDWNAANDFGNRDGRTGNLFGVESVPGWDPRAGLQTDHLSYATRPQATRYDFEIANTWNGGWLAIKLNDTFSVEAKPGRATNLANQPDFRVDLLAGSSQEPTTDILRTYNFRYADPAKELSANPTNPIIKRTFKAGDILQKPDDKSVGGKSPFAILTMTAKTTKGPQDVAMPWLHNHPVIEGADLNTTRVGNALDTYDLRLEEVSDFNQNPGGIEFDAETKRGYYGATSFSNGGVSNVPMFRVPIMPAVSLGDLIPANLVVSSNLPRVTHAFGNSRAHPLIPAGAVSRASPAGGTGQMLDHSYLINNALWDSTFFSTVGSFTTPLLPGTKRGAMLADFFNGENNLLNPRFIPLLPPEGSADQQAERLDKLGDAQLAKELGGYLGIRGAFNVNSDSVDAWRALLSSLRDAELRGWTLADLAPKDKTGFPRTGLPIAGDSESFGAKAGLDLSGQIRWAGFRALDDKQIKLLAEKIVEEIRERGKTDKAPSLTLGEFVNRRLGTGLHTLAGLLQTAIDESQINEPFHNLDSVDLSRRPVTSEKALTGIANPAARSGKSAEGAPSMLTQGDLLMALAPVITVRGDTFRIRAYGESRTRNGAVTATAVCEAVIQRMPDYLDTSEDAALKTADLKQTSNIRFGRRLSIVSFRWLSPDEI
ncbi:MAG: hypothetical protein J0M04_00585 [Verrucomicrobia bacterium]|nr:hypothetical protein [Verrucomicrobiota bacterium]